MARVPYLEKADLAEEHQALLSRPINLFRALVNSPGAARAFSGLGGYIRNKSPLDTRLRELAILQVGYITNSEYEYSHHIKIGREFGVSEEDLRALMQESAGEISGLDEVSRMVLRGAREMTGDHRMSDEAYEFLQNELGNECLVDLVVTIGFYNAVVRVLATLEVDVEDSYLAYLDEYPLPANRGSQ
jgi:alkylhydroperoxidase family enzyme